MPPHSRCEINVTHEDDAIRFLRRTCPGRQLLLPLGKHGHAIAARGGTGFAAALK